MNLLLLEPGELSSEGLARLTDDRARHVREVLRASAGQHLRVGVVGGPAGTATVVELDATSVSLACALEAAPPRPLVHLLLALPRPKVLRRLWPQLAALGVARIVLTNAERVERNYFDTHLLAPAEYRPLLIEGLQQARDTHLPEVSVHRQFRVLVEDHLDPLLGDAVRLVAHPDAAQRVHDALAPARSGRTVALAVGPEGGWNRFELALLERHGFMRVDMGARTLRSDTACIALLALVHDALRGAHDAATHERGVTGG